MKQEYKELLKELVAMKPVSSDVAAVNNVSARIEEFLKARGVRVVREDVNGRNTLYASSLPEGKTTKLLFNSHIDVVPLANPEQGEAVEKDGRIYGRGVGDCLGHAVALVQLLCENKNCSFGAIFTTDEEIGGLTTAEMLRRGYVGTEGVVILDCWSDGDLAFGEKGMLNVRITAHGKGGHAAYPWDAVNALDLLIAGYSRLRAEWKNADSADSWSDTMSATAISCDSTAFNVVPGEASMVLNIRYTAIDGEAAVIERIKKATGLDDVKLLDDCAVPVVCDENAPFLLKVAEIAADVRGKRPRFYKMHGATDARHVAQICPGVPILMDGCRHGGIHSAGEWMDLEDFDNVISIYGKLIKENA